jgi:hypothetical protein
MSKRDDEHLRGSSVPTTRHERPRGDLADTVDSDLMPPFLREATAIDVENRERDRRIERLETIIDGTPGNPGLMTMLTTLGGMARTTQRDMRWVLVLISILVGASIVTGVAVVTMKALE